MVSRVISVSVTFVLLVVPFLAVPVGIWSIFQGYVKWIDIVLFFVFYLISGLGITGGFHRYLIHGGFKTSPFVECCLLIAGCTGFVGTPLWFAAGHRKHHQFSDKPGDLHSPVVDNLFYSHLGWLFRPDGVDVRKYAKDIIGASDRQKRGNPRAMWIGRTYLVYAGLSLLIPFLIDGWQGLLWGGLIRIFVVHHATWAVNSISHRFGKRPFKTSDASRNNWLVAIFAFGEGWHNNHHADQVSALHGFTWKQFDLTGITILLLERLGLIWDVKRPNPIVLERLQAREERVSQQLAA